MVNSLLKHHDSILHQPVDAKTTHELWLRQEIIHCLNSHDHDQLLAQRLANVLIDLQVPSVTHRYYNNRFLQRLFSNSLVKRLSKKCPLDFPVNKRGDSPLMVLIQRGCFNSASCLVRHGAALEYKNAQQETALSQALKRQYVAAVRFLINKGEQSALITQSIFDEHLDLFGSSLANAQVTILLLLAKAAYYILLDINEVRQCLMLAYGLDPIVTDRLRQDIANEQLFELLPSEQRAKLAEECLQIKIDFHLNELNLFSWDDDEPTQNEGQATTWQ